MRINRREFARLTALAAGGHALNATGQEPGAQKPVGYAAIGLGTISDIFMRACEKSRTAKITALVTGHPGDKGKKYAARYGVPESSVYTYEQFDRIRDNKAVDAVYVGLPNSMHREYTIRAAGAGKHVLCEKPMAISSAECREMIDACAKAKVKLMIAYRCHYDPAYLEAERLIQAGALGTLQAFEGAFGFYAGNPDQWRLKKKLAGGGSLMDVGIYPLNAMRFLLREEPAEFKAYASTIDKANPRFAEMEQTISWTMTFHSGVLATAASSYGASMPGFLRINGSKGSLEIAPAYDYTGIHLRSLNGVKADVAGAVEQTDDFVREAEHFADCIRRDMAPRTPGEEGLKDLVAMEAIYRAAGTPIA